MHTKNTKHTHELLYGAEKSPSQKNKSATERLVNHPAQPPYNCNSMKKAVELIHTLEQTGNRTGIFDELIAGICLSRDPPLTTRNTKHKSARALHRAVVAQPSYTSPELYTL